MKKIFFILSVAVILVLTSCEGGKKCPAYDSLNTIQKALTTINK